MKMLTLAIALSGLLTACHKAPEKNAAANANGNAQAAAIAPPDELDAGADAGPSARDLGPLRIGASPVPHAQLINAIVPQLKEQGIEVQVTTFEDYSLPNVAVVRGDLDANFFQTEPYLWRWRAAHGGDLGVAGKIHVEPMGIWSKTVSNLGSIPDNGRVALPSDPANLGRALFLLKKAGLIELDERKGLDALLSDITSNPHKLKFELVSAEKVPKFYSSDTLIVVNGNYALEAKLPMANAVFREDETSPFVNVVVTLEKNLKDPRVVALVSALRGPVARKFMTDTYNGAVLTAF